MHVTQDKIHRTLNLAIIRTMAVLYQRCMLHIHSRLKRSHRNWTSISGKQGRKTVHYERD
jgi:hypothetical protein